MSRVLILSLVFGPDTVSTANMMTDLARGLQTRGHDVTVLTSSPHYNPSLDLLANRSYRPRFPRVVAESHENGLRVLRVRMPLKGRRIWRRALDYLWFHLITIAVAAVMIRRQNVTFVPSPPITLGVSGSVVSLLLRARLIYDVRELWPDVPVRMGLIRSPMLRAMIGAMEQFVYRRSAAITAIAQGFIESLVQRGVPREKLHFTPNFVDVTWLAPRPKANAFATEYHLTDKYVLLYAGNLGLTQGLEILVEIASAFAGDPEVRVVIVGGGAGRLPLAQAVTASGLSNIHLLPFQPYARVPEIYGAADVCLSPMRAGYSYDTVPSKMYTALAAGRPVIAACERDTESAWVLTESGGGEVVEPESASAMVCAIRRLRESPSLREEMGRRARQWVMDNCSSERVIDAYDRVISSVAAFDGTSPEKPRLGGLDTER
jgi:colanic acid biosynthesis glycosyl transferase WcaI